MNTFTFTDNRGIHKHVVTLTATELAQHLAKDAQFMFYWRRGIDPMLAATRSLYINSPDPKAIVPPNLTEDAWSEVHAELCALATTVPASR